MDAYRTDDISSWSVTRLYTDAKDSNRHAIPASTPDEPPEVLSLHRKFRIQKDKLLAWGLDWTDDRNAEGGGNINESVERAGLTEVVSSVMENIIGICDQADQIRHKFTAPQAQSRVFPVEKEDSKPWSAEDLRQYEVLIADLAEALDLLCDLSEKHVRTPPSEKTGLLSNHDTKSEHHHQLLKDSDISQGYEQVPKIARRLDRSLVLMPEEAPPPYDSHGMPCAVRIVGKLRVNDSYTDFKGVTHSEATLPVLVEYASFDTIYRDSDLPLPDHRLHELSKVLSLAQVHQKGSLLNFLGYFNDSSRPRIGLVYELPISVTIKFPLTSYPASALRPDSLFNLLQSTRSSAASTSTAANANANSVPALEDRFRLASELVSSLSFLLQHDYSHQDVNSNNVIFFPQSNTRSIATNETSRQYQLRKPLLCGFDLFSESNMEKARENIDQNIYRHEDDPRVSNPHGNLMESTKAHHPRFDIYSLGLILLEVGLWTPLGEIYKSKYSLKDFSLRLEKIWVRRLASKCGSAYMRAAKECLKAGNDASATTQSLQQVYHSVQASLDRCCLLDDENLDDDELPQDTMQKMASPQGVDAVEALQTNEDHKPVAPQALRTYQQANLLDPDYELSSRTGPSARGSKCPRYDFSDRALSKEVLHQWDHMADQLSKVVCWALRESKESCSINITSSGELESTARPTLCVLCKNTKAVAKALLKHFKYDQETFDLVILKGKIVRSRARSKQVRRSAGTLTNDEENPKNPYYHARPLGGASIGAWRSNEHYPPVSFGGVLLVDGVPYGMSVHHLLEDPDQDDNEADEDGNNYSPSRLTEESLQQHRGSSVSVADFEPSLQSMTSDTDSVFDDTDSDISELDFSQLDLEGNEGDTVGIKIEEGNAILITQPALNDVADDFFPCDEDRDEDHIDSHTLGHVHASSGLRRLERNGISHEVDWSLLALHPDRLQPHNLITGGARFCTAKNTYTPPLLDPICRQSYQPCEDLFPRSVARDADLPDLPVHCFSRTSGLGSGRISRAMTLVRFPGRRSFSRSWTVAGDFGIGGDSGAWVVDNREGRICGHVLAWSEGMQRALIAPMDIMLDDMRAVLAAQVSLPGETALVETRRECAPDLSAVSEAGRSLLLAQHMLQSGNQEHLEREWAARRSALGGVVS